MRNKKIPKKNLVLVISFDIKSFLKLINKK